MKANCRSDRHIVNVITRTPDSIVRSETLNGGCWKSPNTQIKKALLRGNQGGGREINVQIKFCEPPNLVCRISQMSAVEFVGDGSCKGDGGPLLQRLWEKWPWRPVVNVKGQYQMRRVGDGVPPEALCETAGIKKVKLDKLKRGGQTVVVVELEGGGGLVTIVNGDGTFVHTLNTRSSLDKYRAGS
jgi:hypothetical protein